jgi:hypothetical protein
MFFPWFCSLTVTWRSRQETDSASKAASASAMTDSPRHRIGRENWKQMEKTPDFMGKTIEKLWKNYGFPEVVL